MILLRSLHKSAFLSQFVLSIVAVFAMSPIFSASSAAVQDRDSKTVANQRILSAFNEFSTVQKTECSQSVFLQFTLSFQVILPQQMGIFCNFFAVTNRLYFVNPPIRAGPV
ncbi:uncharacterized protein DUF2547 [Nicoletella semolina]|uniref:Uncharacterized protein DUF2547 n=1 Tax=Nicoletella semolina TaxID=271160 RepID=A0A4V2SKB2_9PAST|nr:secA translation cis-regulator SecM [Nicoletella semolina]MDH2924207.1 hypothetical protein [Nicoletella semolina]TCP18896.1 uncharacterized protein DUF2547 [Nicoletella semolina]